MVHSLAHFDSPTMFYACQPAHLFAASDHATIRAIPSITLIHEKLASAIHCSVSPFLSFLSFYTEKRNNGETEEMRNLFFFFCFLLHLSVSSFLGFLGFLGFSISPFSRFLGFSIARFSRFSRFLGFWVFSVFWFSRFSKKQPPGHPPQWNLPLKAGRSFPGLAHTDHP